MKSLVLTVAVVVTLLSVPTPKANSIQDDSGVAVLRNSDVLAMVKAKIPPDVIIAKINSSSCRFDTFPSVLTELKQQGVPDSVLLAMVEAPAGPPAKFMNPKPAKVTDPKPAELSETKKPENIGGVILSDRSETPHNSRFYIAPMDEGFDGLIAALMIEKKLPVTIVSDENLADFMVVGGTNKGPHKWYDTVFGGGYERDRNQGNIRVIRVKDKTVIWASQAGDRSVWWGSLKKGGRRKVAERLVNKMKDRLFKSAF